MTTNKNDKLNAAEKAGALWANGSELSAGHLYREAIRGLDRAAKIHLANRFQRGARGVADLVNEFCL